MTNIDRIQLSYDLTFQTPFHCGTGLRVGLLDRTVVRDHDGYLYVPGSTLKGCLREQCELLARLYEELDDEMRARITSPHDKRKALWAMGHPATMITRIFGLPSSPSRLFFEDARQTPTEKLQYDDAEEEGKYKGLQTTLSTQVRLHRPTRTAVSGALYTSEFGIKDCTFAGSIMGWLPCRAIETLEGTPTYSLLLLLAGLCMVDRLGGNTSTGKGLCQITIKQLKINDTVCTEARWQSWFNHLEVLSYYSTDVANQEEEEEA